MKLNPIFHSHMVFAAHQPIRIYGEGAGRAEITFAGETRTVESHGDFWLLEFPPMEKGGPYTAEILLNDTPVTLSDVYVGEVYLMAGQSNMQFKLNESNTPKELYESEPRLRLFSTHRIEKSDRFTPEDGWVIAEKDNVGDWTALGYLIGKERARSHDTPVGIITAYQGASAIESWLPAGILAANGISLPLDKRHVDHTHGIYGQWNGDGVLYQYALTQIFPFSLSAVVWYQGESDTTEAEGTVYHEELTLFIETLRKDFRQPDLPVAVIVIADFDPRNDDGWHLVQEAQKRVGETVPHTAAIPCTDICEKDQIHPPTKTLLASRVATALDTLL